jgi:hypothetical protein
MNRPISRTVRTQVAQIRPEILMLRWLGTIDRFNARVESLIHSGQLTCEKATEMQMPVKLPPGMVEFMIKQLKWLQVTLRDHPHFSHWDLLSAAQPLVAFFYRQLSQQWPAPLDSLRQLYSREFQPLLQKHLPLDARLPDGRRVFQALREETTDFKAHEQKTCTISDAIRSVMESFDLSLLDKQEQIKALEIASPFLETITQLHPSWFDVCMQPLFTNNTLPTPNALKTMLHLRRLKGVDLLDTVQNSELKDTPLHIVVRKGDMDVYI